jgi:K+-transporting ATPase KdpF subunit
MGIDYITGLVIAGALMLYLFYVIVKPEKF